MRTPPGALTVSRDELPLGNHHNSLNTQPKCLATEKSEWDMPRQLIFASGIFPSDLFTLDSYNSLAHLCFYYFFLAKWCLKTSNKQKVTQTQCLTSSVCVDQCYHAFKRPAFLMSIFNVMSMPGSVQLGSPRNQVTSEKSFEWEMAKLQLLWPGRISE